MHPAVRKPKSLAERLFLTIFLFLEWHLPDYFQISPQCIHLSFLLSIFQLVSSEKALPIFSNPKLKVYYSNVNHLE
jgi:hypothetical protein